MITTELRSAFRFFSEHAGYIVGKHAKGALDLARAEQLLRRAEDLGIAAVEWVDDDLPWDEGTEISAEEASEKFASNEWTGPYVCLVGILAERDDRPDTLSYTPRVYDTNGAIGGIVLNSRGTNDPYARVVVAELASELADDLRQAIGDALDREQCTTV